MTPQGDATLDVVIIGAGSAGIAAAKTARERGLKFRVVEASHRIGGRAHTEEIAPGTVLDLGCHWLHSGSLNPYAGIADALGFTYRKEPYGRDLHVDGNWASEARIEEFESYADASYATIHAAVESGRDVAVAEVLDNEHRCAPLLHYWLSLGFSTDCDQVSTVDVTSYRDTDENWPVREGYGALVARFGANVPVELNCAATRVDWSGKGVRVSTGKGALEACSVIVTVSNGILGAGDIDFSPALPVSKQEAIDALPIGNYNYICLRFDRNVLGPDHPPNVSYYDGSDRQMWFRARPFGYDYIVGATGGRFATWLERAGVEASADYARECVTKIFGADIFKHYAGRTVSAWGSDPWVKGAYSAARPGQGHQRATLAEPVAGRVFFAGEATSSEFFSTCHGAYFTGIRAANEVADALSVV